MLHEMPQRAADVQNAPSWCGDSIDERRELGKDRPAGVAEVGVIDICPTEVAIEHRVRQAATLVDEPAVATVAQFHVGTVEDVLADDVECTRSAGWASHDGARGHATKIVSNRIVDPRLRLGKALCGECRHELGCVTRQGGRHPRSRPLLQASRPHYAELLWIVVDAMALHGSRSQHGLFTATLSPGFKQRKMPLHGDQG